MRFWRKLIVLSTLGSIVTNDGLCARKIRARLSQAQQSYFKKIQKVTATSNSIDFKKRTVKTYRYCWSTLLCGCESWTLRYCDARFLEAAEVWFWRRIRNIKWSDKWRWADKNEWRTLLIWHNNSLERQLRGASTVQHRHSSILINILETKIKGKRTRERKRVVWQDDLKQKAGVNSYGELKRLCEDRGERKKIMTFNWAMTLQTFVSSSLSVFHCYMIVLCVTYLRVE